MESRLTLRLPPDLLAFLKAEAGQQGISLSESVKNLIARGLREQSFAEEIKLLLASLTKSEERRSDEKFWQHQLEAIAEIRSMLRALAVARDANLVTHAKQQAKKEVADLLAQKE